MRSHNGMRRLALAKFDFLSSVPILHIMTTFLIRTYRISFMCDSDTILRRYGQTRPLLF